MTTTIKILLLAVCLGLCAVVSAQTVTGTLDGHITDQTGALVPRVTVTAKNVATGVERTTTANEAGYYEMPFLPLGRYTVTSALSGFTTVIAEDIDVMLNRTTTLNLTMKVSTVESSVTVNDAMPLVDLASGQIRRSLDDTIVGIMPNGGRNFLNIVTLFPGFQSNPTSGQNNWTLSSGSSVSFNGTGTRGTTFMTDGINNDDSSENQNRQPVNISTIKEIQMLTDNFAPEFGRGFGSVMLVQTKSGSNRMHGEAYWYLQNSALNARSYFANAAGSRLDAATGKMVPNQVKAVSQTHRMGGTIGGAAIKDKLFYFGSIERFWQPGSATVSSYLLPPEWRTPQVDPTVPDAAARKAWVQSVIDRFPANLTPNNAPVSPYAYAAPMPRSSHTADYTGRADWHIRDTDMFYARYQFSNYFYGLPQEIVKGENMRQDHRNQNFGVTETHIFSPTTTGEFRFGYGRRRLTVNFIDPSDYAPIIRWSYTGFAPIIGNAGTYPTMRYENDYQYVYNLVKELGSRHSLKFGTDIRRSQLNDRAENYNRGYWTFGSQSPYDGMQNFLRGVVTTYQKGYGPAYVGMRATELNFYGQDEFRATNNLRFVLGFRVESVGAPSEVNHLYDVGYGTDRYVEPRFSFAWSPNSENAFLRRLTGGSSKTSIRGGFGMFHGRIFQSIFTQSGANTRFNPPNAATLTWTNSNMSAADPTGGYVFKAGAPTSQVALTTVDPNMHMPYTEQWNFTVDRQLPWDAALQVSYVGNRGIGLLYYNSRNRAQFPITSTQPANYQGTIFPGVTFNQIDPNLFNASPAPGFISLQQPRTEARRMDGRYSLDLDVSNAAWSYYNALQLQYTQRMKHGVTLQASYTWSKNIDTGSEATYVGTGDTNQAVSEKQSMRSMRAFSRLAQPQRFAITYVYDVPLFKDQKGPSGWNNKFAAGIIGRALGGWQVSGNSTFASGTPFTVSLGYDLNGDGIGGDRPFLMDTSLLGRSIDNARIDPSTGRQYSQSKFPTSAFYPGADIAASKLWPWYPGTGMVASLGRNTFWTHGINNFDMAFIKNVRLYGEGRHLQFRAEMFNLFNRVQFSMPAYVSVVDTGVAGWRLQPRFGEITSQYNSPRWMQMSLRYFF